MNDCTGYLRIEGIQGACTDPRFQGCIEISTINMMQEESFGRSHSSATATLGKLLCSGPHQAGEPQLSQYCMNRHVVKSAKLTWLRGSTAQLRISLLDVVVDNFEMQDGSMCFTLAFSKIDEFQTMTPREAKAHMRLAFRQ